jgi:hypothetical protein
MNTKTITNSWICNSCRRTIRDAANAWVEWHESQEGDKSNFSRVRIVHHCTAHTPTIQRLDKEARARIGSDWSYYDYPLNELLGADGLMVLLGMLERAAHPVSELLELLKRLHRPGYDWWLLYHDYAVQEGVIPEPSNRDHPTREEIDAVVAWSRTL